jgi:hypothetical protein
MVSSAPLFFWEIRILLAELSQYRLDVGMEVAKTSN